MANVLVEKNKLDILANAISNKSGEPLTLTLDEMVEAVDGIEQGIQPSGNINITQAGQTDVTNYATATVPTADANAGSISSSYVTENNQRKWKFTYEGYAESPGWVDEGAFGPPQTYEYNAIPSNTTVTPTTSAQTIGGANYMMEGAVTVNAIPSNYVGSGITRRSSTDLTVSGATVTAPSGYYSASASGTVASGSLGSYTSQNNTKTGSYLNVTTAYPDFKEGYFSSMPDQTAQLALEDKSCTPSQSQQIITPSNVNCYLNSVTVSAMPSGTAGTPTARKGTVSNHSVSVTPSVTNTTGYITGGTINGTAVSISASELVSGTLNVTSAGTKDVTNYASASIPNGTAGTPTATKGTVSNHSVSVTPSVTNNTGFITGSTKSGTAVTVSASELVSGSETKTENGTYDVTNLAEIVIDVQGGGSSGITVATLTASASINSSIQFTGLQGAPTSFAITSVDDISTNSVSNIADIVFDGSTFHGQGISTEAGYLSSGTFTPTYNNGVLQINASGAQFVIGNTYKLVYTYGGSTSDIHTSDIQVGSGATSITFPVSGRPIYWSCIFKSSFSTSQGYQRVIAATNDSTNTYGLCLDSSAHASNQYWTASYSGGNLTISSQGTNAGGYFHQPGYYQLTYVVDSSAPSYETVSKTYRASTSAQSEKIEPSTGYDAISEVNISIPAVTQTNLVAGNIKSGTTISISNGSTNLWSVTGTYTGGGSSTCDTETMTNSNDQATSIQFTGLSGQPKWFFVRCTSQLSRSSSYSYYYITAVRYNGTNHYGNYYRRSNGTFYNDTTHYSHTYSNGTLTVSSSASRGAAGGSFYNGTYELVYIY